MSYALKMVLHTTISFSTLVWGHAFVCRCETFMSVSAVSGTTTHELRIITRKVYENVRSSPFESTPSLKNRYV